jgi:hypothetical protein
MLMSPLGCSESRLASTEKLLAANAAEGRARLVATSGSRYLTADRRSARVPTPVG